MSKKNTLISQPKSKEPLPEENLNAGEQAIEEKPKAGKEKFGNQDKDKKHDISGLKVPKDHYVVRHFSTVALANGQSMEDPSTNRFQVYSQHDFKKLSEQSVKDGKQVASQFNVLGLNVDILHDPTK